MKIGGTVNITGNAFLYEGASATLSGSLTYNGKIFVDSYSSAVQKGGVNVEVASMGEAELAARSTILSLASGADSLSATQPLDPVYPEALDLNRGVVYTADPAVKVNVISARHMDLSSGGVLRLVGDSTSVFLIKVSGIANFGGGIQLSGALPKNVLIYVNSKDSTAGVSIGGTSGVAGTFLSLDRAVSFSGQGVFQGAIISGASASPAISFTGNGGGTVAEIIGDAFCAK